MFKKSFIFWKIVLKLKKKMEVVKQPKMVAYHLKQMEMEAVYGSNM